MYIQFSQHCTCSKIQVLAFRKWYFVDLKMALKKMRTRTTGSKDKRQSQKSFRIFVNDSSKFIQ